MSQSKTEQTTSQEKGKKVNKWKDRIETADFLTNGAKDLNTVAGTFSGGIAPAGKDVSLDLGQFYNNQSFVHIALSCVTLPLALVNLGQQYKNIEKLKNKAFETTENSPDLSNLTDYRLPKDINKSIISIKQG